MIMVRTSDQEKVVYKEATRFYFDSDGDLQVFRDSELLGAHARDSWSYARVVEEDN